MENRCGWKGKNKEAKRVASRVRNEKLGEVCREI